MNRRDLLGTLAVASMLQSANANAQTAPKVHRLGCFFAGWSEKAERVSDREGARKDRETLVRDLAARGYALGRNLTVDWRYFDMDFSQAPRMAVELVAGGVDVLHTVGTPQTKALQDATKTIPIITSVGDPMASGFTTSLARPSGNVTGLAQAHPDTPAKEVALLRSIVPMLDRIALIGDSRYPGGREILAPLATAARTAGLRPEILLVTPSEFEQAFAGLRRSGTRAAYLLFPGSEGLPAIEPAIRHGIATMFVYPDYVEQGGLIGYSMHHANREERYMVMIDKLFKGVRIADIPWELPDRSLLALNLRTAKALGLAIAPDLLLRANLVVE